MSSKILIEVCCGSVDDAVGGALRPPEDRYDLIDRNIIQSVSELLSR